MLEGVFKRTEEGGRAYQDGEDVSVEESGSWSCKRLRDLDLAIIRSVELVHGRTDTDLLKRYKIG